VAVWQRDKTTIITGLIIAGGFGIGFMQSALWTLGYGTAPKYIDWWKMWELNAGFNLGVLYAISFYWAIRQFDKTYKSESTITIKKVKSIKSNVWRDTLFLAFTGFVLLYFVGFEYFFWTGLVLSLLYFITMCLTPVGTHDTYLLEERRKNIFLIYSAFILIFLLFHGGSERFGIVFELYELDEVAQYSWPVNRIVVFVPFAIVITVVALFKMRKVLRPIPPGNQLNSDTSKLSIRIIELMTLIAFIGVLSIWPAKISIFYAMFLMFAVFAFNRLERHFNKQEIKFPLN
jgi:hypothetical protein